MKSLSFPFRLSNDGRLATTTSYAEIVRGQVIDVLMTNQGERVFRPRYGSDIQSALFDPTDELVRHDAASVIRQRLENYTPRCIVRDISIVAEANLVVVNILYRPSLYATDTTLSVPVSSEFLSRARQPLEVSQ